MSAPEEWHSYVVGRLDADGQVEMFDEPIDEGPVTPLSPEGRIAWGLDHE